MESLLQLWMGHAKIQISINCHSTYQIKNEKNPQRMHKFCLQDFQQNISVSVRIEVTLHDNDCTNRTNLELVWIHRLSEIYFIDLCALITIVIYSPCLARWTHAILWILVIMVNILWWLWTSQPLWDKLWSPCRVNPKVERSLLLLYQWFIQTLVLVVHVLELGVFTHFFGSEMGVAQVPHGWLG